MPIQMGELIAIGETYHSKCGNVITIDKEKEVVEKNKKGDKRTTHFRGTIIDTIEGHEILLGKQHWFNENGKWLKHKDGIHDLAKLCTLKHEDKSKDKHKDKDKDKDKDKKK